MATFVDSFCVELDERMLGGLRLGCRIPIIVSDRVPAINPSTDGSSERGWGLGRTGCGSKHGPFGRTSEDALPRRVSSDIAVSDAIHG